MFGEKTTVQLNQRLEEHAAQLSVNAFATMCVCNLIAAVVAKCERTTYWNNKPVKKDEYYTWNVEPNGNQSASDFFQELIMRLLLENEALVVEVGGQLILAEGFSVREYAVVPNVYEGVTRKGMQFSRPFFENEVLHFRLNNSNIRAHLSGLLCQYEKLLALAQGKFKRAGGRKGTITIDKTATGDADAKERLSKLFEGELQKYYEAENGVMHLTRGVSYTEITGEGSKKSTSDVVDIVSLTREAFARAAQAYRVPTALVMGDVAGVEEITENFIAFCIAPVCKTLEAEITRKRSRLAGYLKGNYLKIDTSSIRAVDVFAAAEKVDKLISSGLFSVDEIRRKLGEAELGEEWSTRHWITRNYEGITEAKGGETK